MLWKKELKRCLQYYCDSVNPPHIIYDNRSKMDSKMIIEVKWQMTEEDTLL